MAAGSVIESGFRCWERNIRFSGWVLMNFYFLDLLKGISIWMKRMIGWAKNLFFGIMKKIDLFSSRKHEQSGNQSPFI
jgi:hypothetical protein